MTTMEQMPHFAEADALVMQLLTDPPSDPHPLFKRVREIAPVHRTASGVWTVATYDLVDEVARDPRFIRNADDIIRRQHGDVDYSRPVIQSRLLHITQLNPPEYTRKRREYAKFVTPAAVDKLRGEIEENANSLLDAVEDRGEIELVSEFSYGLALKLICRILGFPPPEGGQAEFLEWFRAFAHIFRPVVTEAEFAEADDAILNLGALMTDRLEMVRRNPTDNLIARLTQVEFDGAPLPDDEIVANAILLFAASVSTTADAISNTVIALMENRDQWEMLTADPEGMVKNAVEESIRYDPSTTANPPNRFAPVDIPVGDFVIPAGEVVVPLWAAGNRDPKRYEDPDRYDITRQDIRPLTFGGGLHVCPGQHLGRAQTQIALQVLATRFPNMTLLDGKPPVRWAMPVQRGAQEVHLRLK